VIIEIAAAFLVTFVVCALSLHAWGNYRRPLGFSYENIWRVTLSDEALTWMPNKPLPLAKPVEDILAAIRGVPGVLGAHSIEFTPFEGGASVGPLGRDGASIPTWENRLSAAAVADLGVRIVAGRNFGPEDEGQDYIAALVNRDFVAMAYGGASPLGRRINFATPQMLARMTPEQARQIREIRAVGVIDDFRQNGEFMEKTPYAILLADPHDNDNLSLDLLVKVAPGTERRFEERIVAAVRGAAVGFNATVTPWQELRASNHLEALLRLRIGAILAVFLLAMVALGLIGIVWLDVVRRTREMGLRRAAGASAGAVCGQILLEVLVIGSAAIVIGCVLAVQIPLLSIVPQIDWAAALPALGLSALLILLLAAGAALYPALLASGREPADALRYE